MFYRITFIHLSNIIHCYFRIDKCTASNTDKSKVINLISNENGKLIGHDLLNVSHDVSKELSLEISFNTFAFELNSQEMFNL